MLYFFHFTHSNTKSVNKNKRQEGQITDTHEEKKTVKQAAHDGVKNGKLWERKRENSTEAKPGGHCGVDT